MNSAALRSGQDMILIDAGMTFPKGLGSDLGVDIIVPDITFLKDNREQLRALVLTHGHEDHIGSVSYIINEIPVPVYGTRLTLGLVAERLKERQVYEGVDLRIITARQRLEIGPFQIEPLHVTHSFPDSFCLAITTPVGHLIWTGDFKFDQTPIDRKLSDMPRLAEYGDKGVLALFSDSTNSQVSGLSPSEFSVYDLLRSLFHRASGKIIVSCFASSLHRIQIILDLARELDRKVLPIGRSMISNIRIAGELGHLQVPADLLINAGDVRNVPPEKLLIVATGSQGEPMSALSRLAVNEVKGVEVTEGDMVILSTRIIPGNEKLIANLVNHFYRRGARVYDSHSAPVHVSGHGHADDLKLMINLTRPRFFIPIHGDYQQLKVHSWIARDQGIPSENVCIIENGDIFRLTRDCAEVSGKATVGRRFIDEGILEEVQEVVLRDRRYLSEDGFIVVVLKIDRFSGNLIGSPELISRGFVLMESSEELFEATRAQIEAVVRDTPIEEKRDEALFQEILRKELKRFLRKQTGKRPMILPVMLEI